MCAWLCRVVKEWEMEGWEREWERDGKVKKERESGREGREGKWARKLCPRRTKSLIVRLLWLVPPSLPLSLPLSHKVSTLPSTSLRTPALFKSVFPRHSKKRPLLVCVCACDRVEEVPACAITVHCSCGTKSIRRRLPKVTLPSVDYHDPVLSGHTEYKSQGLENIFQWTLRETIHHSCVKQVFHLDNKKKVNVNTSNNHCSELHISLKTLWVILAIIQTLGFLTYKYLIVIFIIHL